MHRLTLIISLLLVTIISLSTIVVQAQENTTNDNWRDYPWKPKKNKNGIQIFTSNVPGSKYNAVYGSMIVRGSVDSLVALVQDATACPKWADLCKESRIIKTISPTEYYAYTYNDVPFPVKDRDAVTKIKWSQDPETLVTLMTAKPAIGLVEKTKAVRIEEVDSRWYFSPQADGTTKVETFAHINPNGPTPAWLTNMLLVSSPYKTMKAMRELIEGGSYANAKSIFE